jgi:hypothetical protein
MGRWAQRTRRGGGPGTAPPPTITITQVFVDDFSGGTIQVDFSAAVTAAMFDPGAFRSDSGLDPGEDVAQVGANSLLYHAVAWESNLNTGDPWQYTDSVSDVVTPQSGLLS